MKEEEEEQEEHRMSNNDCIAVDDDIQDVAQKIYGRRPPRRPSRKQNDEEQDKNGDDADHDKEDDSEAQQSQSQSCRSRPCELLAPMVRASTTPLRTLSLKYGADMCYSEELVDRSISSTIRVVNPELGTIDYVKNKSNLSKKTQRKLGDRPCLMLRISQRDELLKTNENPYGRFICQLGTGEPELALPAAQRVYEDAAAIDVNMGCPKKFSVSGGMGSALLKDPDRASRIIKTLRHGLASPSSPSLSSNEHSNNNVSKMVLPVSCKIRLLPTIKQTVEFVDAMISAGANAVAIHARKAGQEAIVDADWKSLEEVLGILRPKYPRIPLLINGDFYDRQERYEFMERTKIDGVLLGRPALYNCSTFYQYPKPLLDKTNIIQEYLTEAVRYDTHPKNAKYVICEMMTNRRTPTSRVLKLPIQFPGGQTIAKTCDCQAIQSLCKVWNVNYSHAMEYKEQQQQEFQLLNYSQSEPALASSPSAAAMPLAPGESRYDDSYFLKHLKTAGATTSSGTKHAKEEKAESSVAAESNNKNDLESSTEPSNKRAKLQ